MTAEEDVFARFEAVVERIPNWIGITTKRSFFESGLDFVRPVPPVAGGPEYFEWIDVLASVLDAGDEYTFIELGAGYGRWVVNAAAAIRAIGRSRYRLVAVEAEPTHFRWLAEHCADNGVERQSNLGSLQLVEAAVTADGNPVEFAVGNPAVRLHIGTYGPEVEAGLRAVLSEHGWRCLRDYSAFSLAATPWGEMQFQDGTQTWSNPRLDSPLDAADYDGPRHVD